MIAGTVPKGRTRGKSGLHRAGCRVTPGQGDLKESATEINRLMGYHKVRVERRGKSSPVSWRQETLCKPHLEQHRKRGHIGCPPVLKGGLSHVEIHGLDR